MGFIMNLLVILPYYLAFVHGLVIPRDDLERVGISSCNELDGCLEIANSGPPLDKLNDTPLEVKNFNWEQDNFITSYVDPSGKVQPLEFNPASLNNGLLNQLQPDPLKLNQNFVDQLIQVMPESTVVPTIDSSDRSSIDSFLDGSDLWKQAKVDPLPTDDVWHTDNFDILS